MFPIPEICELITLDTKIKVLHTTERDDQGSKVSDFFERTEDMFNEMKWQKKLRGMIDLNIDILFITFFKKYIIKTYSL